MQDCAKIKQAFYLRRESGETDVTKTVSNMKNKLTIGAATCLALAISFCSLRAQSDVLLHLKTGFTLGTPIMEIPEGATGELVPGIRAGIDLEVEVGDLLSLSAGAFFVQALSVSVEAKNIA